MSEFNFKSAVCTSRSQSERLLALGLKPKTADMCYFKKDVYGGKDVARTEVPEIWTKSFSEAYIPAWSLHRLIEMMPISLPCEKMQGLEGLFNITWHQDKTFTIGYVWSMEKCGNLYDAMVYAIEWLIKEGYFNKEYLCKR